MLCSRDALTYAEKRLSAGIWPENCSTRSLPAVPPLLTNVTRHAGRVLRWCLRHTCAWARSVTVYCLRNSALTKHRRVYLDQARLYDVDSLPSQENLYSIRTSLYLRLSLHNNCSACIHAGRPVLAYCHISLAVMIEGRRFTGAGLPLDRTRVESDNSSSDRSRRIRR